MVEKPSRKDYIDTVGSMGEHVVLSQGQEHLKNHYDSKTDHEYLKGGEAFVHQHFINDNLHYKRRSQAYYLQGKCRQQHIDQGLFVLDYGRYEPFEPEGHLPQCNFLMLAEDHFPGEPL